MENNVQDKWLIVYQGYLNQYKNDYAKDSYNDKLVLVTGNKESPSIDARKSYLCVANEENSIEIPIPDLWIEKIQIGNDTRSWTTRVLNLAKENGINISFGDDGKTVTIGIDKDTLGKIDSIDNKVEQTEYNDKVAELEASIGGKYTKPAGGIPAKDLAAEVATETEVVNAISKAAADLNDKIDNKISKTDTLPAENVGVLSNGAKGLASTNPIIANRIPYLKADAFAFLQPEDFTVEVAYDGSTWVTFDNNNADMRGMFAQLSFGTGFPIDGSNTNWQVGSKIRITLSPKVVRHAKVDFVALNVYANGRTFDILTEYYDSSSGKEGWYSVGDQLNISSNGIGFVKYNQYFSFEEYNRKGARFTFTITKNTQYWSKIVGISGFGNLAAEISPTSSTAPHTLGTLWYWDYLKNVYFPNDIYEGGTPLKNKYASITSAIQGIESANDKYISISDVGNTLIPTKKIAIKIASIKGDEDGLVTAQDVRGSMPEIPTELPNPKPLTYKVNGVTSTYNGSSAATIQIFTPTTIGSQGQLLQSMGGGEPQWTNLSSIKEAIGFAKDLTGVLEATPEEFTFRPSAGNKSIRDEGAVIRRIKGNTTVWEQRGRCTVKNWMFEPYGDNGIRQHRQSADIEWSGWEDNAYLQYPQGDKILVEIIPLNNNYLRNVNYFSAFGSTIYINEPKIVTASGNGISMRCSPESIGFIFIPQIHNLTRVFGAGDEPQTYEAFKAIYPDIYPYCEPTIRNVKTTAIETVGFNLFNGEYADLIGGKTYYVGGTGGLGLTFIRNGTDSVLNVVLSTDSTFTPTQSGRLYSNNVNTCVHFQHSGIKDGECADYVEHMLELPEIAKYFHDGMNGIGDVYDEINSENAIQRIGVVNLGTLTWVKYSYSSTNTVYVARDLQGATGKRTAKTAKYSNTTTAIADMPDKTMLTRTDYPTYIYICDNDYSSVEEFASAMQGVYIYYELAEPEIRPILEPIQLVYDVEDFGTERAVSSLPSAPFRADIVYQFNAEGRIRDNGRNIERLEKSLNGKFDGDYVVAKGIVDYKGNGFRLPSVESEGQLYHLATEQYVEDRISTIELSGDSLLPTEIVETTEGGQSYLIQANKVYICLNKINSCNFRLIIENTIPNKDNKWCFRFKAGQGPYNIHTPDFDSSFPTYSIIWKDYTVPTFENNSWYEISFTMVGPVFLGEWKRYFSLQTTSDK